MQFFYNTDNPHIYPKHSWEVVPISFNFYLLIFILLERQKKTEHPEKERQDVAAISPPKYSQELELGQGQAGSQEHSSVGLPGSSSHSDREGRWSEATPSPPRHTPSPATTFILEKPEAAFRLGSLDSKWRRPGIDTLTLVSMLLTSTSSYLFGKCRVRIKPQGFLALKPRLLT